MRPGIAGVIVLIAGCGRIGFDPLAGRDAGADASPGTRRWLMTADYNGADGTLAMYAMNGDTGALNPTNQAPVMTQTRPTYFVTDGKFVFIPHENAAGAISAFAIDPSTGYLAAVPGSPFAGPGANLTILRMHPDGTSFYASGTAGIQCYRWDDQGAIAPTGTPGTLASTFQIAIDPLGRYLYAAAYGTAEIQPFQIDPAGGLTPIGSPVINSTIDIHGISVDNDGNFLVIESTTEANVYRIEPSTGLLTLAQGPYAGGGVWVQFDPQGDHVVIPDQVRGLRSYTFDKLSGALTVAPGSPFVDGTVYWFAAIDPAGKYVIAGSDNSPLLHRFVLDQADGSLDPTGPAYDGTSVSFAMAIFETTP